MKSHPSHVRHLSRNAAVLVVAAIVGVLASSSNAHPDHEHDDDQQGQTLGAATKLTSVVTFTSRDGYRHITANGLPDHEPGAFPNRGNPNRIAEQKYELRMPLKPVVARKPTEVEHMDFGVALNGVKFDPGTAEFWKNDRRSGWRYEAKSGKINLGLDDSNAHVQPNGAYHYHGLPVGLIDRKGGIKQMLLIGYAADGFPIYGPYAYSDAKDAKSELRLLKPSYRIKAGQRPDGPGGKYDGTFVQDYEYVQGLGDLDECNGRVGVTPEFPDCTYYYVLTDSYPFVPRMFKGTPDDSFRKQGLGPGGPGGMGGPQRGGPPPRR
jgi:hypothetical protein